MRTSSKWGPSFRLTLAPETFIGRVNFRRSPTVHGLRLTKTGGGKEVGHGWGRGVGVQDPVGVGDVVGEV